MSQHVWGHLHTDSTKSAIYIVAELAVACVGKEQTTWAKLVGELLDDAYHIYVTLLFSLTSYYYSMLFEIFDSEG